MKSNAPHLETGDRKRLQPIEWEFLRQRAEIEAWFRKVFANQPVPLMSSVDIRHSGYKIAPVDANLFPAGFNNLKEESVPLCVQALQNALLYQYPDCQNILILSENHTRNLRYFESVYRLQHLFQLAGFQVRVGQVDGVQELTHIETPNGHFDLWPVERVGNRLSIKEFMPTLIVLNRDLSEGVPPILVGLEQQLTPPLELGWHKRLKSNHFKFYDKVCLDFSKVVQIDPWFINPLFDTCHEVDFLEEKGLSTLAERVEHLLENIREKYQTHGIKQPPFAVIKAEAGTYGMGVMMVQSGEQLLTLNRKQKNKMSTLKGGHRIEQVIIQEGVYSFETWEEAVAEPVVYSIGSSVVGGFYRVHRNKGIQDNLNTPGMEFKALAFSKACNVASTCNTEDVAAIRFYAYGVIARLALLAAREEFKESTQS